MDKRKVVAKWIKENGCAEIDIKNKEIWLLDGGLFAVDKKIQYLPKLRLKKIREDGEGKKVYEMIPSKGRKKEKQEVYKAYFWMQELDEFIDYLKSMKKMLNSIGCVTKVVKKKSKRGKKK